MKLHVIEGNYQKLDGGSLFGNAPKALWSQWITPDSLNRIQLSTRALLIQTNQGENILLETGIGAFFEPKLKERFGIDQKEHILLKSLATIGLKDSDINHVILSHLHFDHAGGLLSAYDNTPTTLLFPNAHFYVSKTQWQRASNPHPRDKTSFIPLINQLLENSNKLHFIEKETHPNLPFTFSTSNGHTPGMLLTKIKTKQGPLIFTSDLIPGSLWIHTSISMGYDRFPELIIDEKKILLDSLVKEKGYCFFTHCPSNPCVSIQQNEKGKFYGKSINLSSLTPL